MRRKFENPNWFLKYFRTKSTKFTFKDFYTGNFASFTNSKMCN